MQKRRGARRGPAARAAAPWPCA
uniref:Uncharacterized protein n=1 Tax=Arundo donax TaxID=35708 RepID=A0A0A9G272_ARUDO